MSHIIVVRGYRPGDELGCRKIMKESIMSIVNVAFMNNLFKEITFQLMILCAAIMFIFFGIPFSVCFIVIPIVVIVTYLATHIGFQLVVAEINQELSNIPRIYMSNAFSCFWVAEAYEPLLMSRKPEDIHYTVMTEQKFRELNIDVSSQGKKIIGAIGLLKSHKVAKGAWIKRLCVSKHYRQKGVGSCLLNTALQFAIHEGYSCADLVFTEYNEIHRRLYSKNGFELKQMYHRPIIGPIVNVLVYELTHQIKTEHEYGTNNGRKNAFRTD